MSTLPQHDALTYVLGSPSGFVARPLPPFAAPIREFLTTLSERLLSDPRAKGLSDVVSLAYWCRKANLERQSQLHNANGRLRLGRGVVFHIPPTNVPVNFAFSWVFSLLAGNANVMRLPSRDFPQVEVILSNIKRVFEEERFATIAAMNVFVRYAHEADITAAFSTLCDIRIIWGGDAVVQEIRKAPLPPRSFDVTFPDRTSFSVIGSSNVLALSEDALVRLASCFYNDTYLMDQNACSSPRLVVWLGTQSADAARERFWAAVGQEVVRRKYELAPISAVDKLTQACRDAIELPAVGGIKSLGNILYRVGLTRVDTELQDRRCNCGYFYEFATDDIAEISDVITRKYQSLTYSGVSKDDLAQFVVAHRMAGIDRIVPIGAAMDIGLVWDGYDLIATLSRTCDVR